MGGSVPKFEYNFVRLSSPQNRAFNGRNLANNNNNISLTMPSPKQPPARKQRATPKQRKCGGCGQLGHDRRKCPVPNLPPARQRARKQVVNQDGVAGGTSNATPPTTVVQDAPTIDWDKVLYVVFDLETTGHSRHRDEIIEVAGHFLDPIGIQIEDGAFEQLVRPNQCVSPFITQLTTITNDLVSNSERFPAVADAFIRFMQGRADEYSAEKGITIGHIILVAHNGKGFDIPFFIQQLSKHNMLDLLFADGRFGYGIDTLQVARKTIKDHPKASVPTSYSLPILFQFISGVSPTLSHRAMADVKATMYVLRYKIFWETRQECVFRFERPDDLPTPAVLPRPDDLPTPAVLPTQHAGEDNDDSDTSVSGDSQSSIGSSDDDSESSSDTEDDEFLTPSGDAWQNNANYSPLEAPLEKFRDHFTSTGRSRRMKTGLQCSSIDVNTPIRAWREVFKNTILEKIVRYTNEYGQLHAKKWRDITKKDLESFIAVLFVSAVQKRKDKPSNWFSDNRILECTIIKKIMSGRNFFMILRYLHCCPVTPPVGDYDPAYKVSELRDYLEDRYTRLFVPGQQLSLDETLIRAFGRIKFKVRIVTKAARYGIKIYVITDAATAYVLRVLIYTGKSTYGSTDDQDKLKTVQVVEKLVEPFVGSYRTVYVDQFYTSIGLLKALEKLKST
jgi:DNA polymerase III epsilon subunit-like protein